jgi:hypothetical protein
LESFFFSIIQFCEENKVVFTEIVVCVEKKDYKLLGQKMNKSCYVDCGGKKRFGKSENASNNPSLG